MRLRLKEDPKEWRKFALAGTIFGGLIVAAGAYRGWWSGDAGFGLSLGLGAALLAAWLRPRWVRPVYRAAMTASWHVGQYTGRILLALVFWSILVPISGALRILGKDLLGLRKKPGDETYWKKTANRGALDRLY